MKVAQSGMTSIVDFHSLPTRLGAWNKKSRLKNDAKEKNSVRTTYILYLKDFARLYLCGARKKCDLSCIKPIILHPA